MQVTDFLNQINNYSRPYYRLVDFEKIFDQGRATVNKSIDRFIKQGLIQRLMKDVYVVKGQNVNWEQVATMVYKPSYVSLESVLFAHGVINQGPYGITLVTSRRTKKLLLGETECWYSQVSDRLWWGYVDVDGVWRADLEKAIVDMVYLRSCGMRKFDTDEWYWKPIDRKRLDEYLSRADLKI